MRFKFNALSTHSAPGPACIFASCVRLQARRDARTTPCTSLSNKHAR
jgi:hypothetical protein